MSVYRIVKSAEESDFYNLTLYAFNRTDTVQRQKFFQKLFENSYAYGAFDQDHVQSGFLSIPFSSQLGIDRFKTCGISYVSSLPESSGKGHITKLMGKMFEDMDDEGFDVSYLAPFSFPFYRRFGYEEVFDRTSYHVQNIDLPKFKMPEHIVSPELRIKRYPLSEGLQYIKSFHNAHPFSQNGGILRNNWWSEYLVLKHAWEIAICFKNERICGYVIFTRNKNTNFLVNELFYDSNSALFKLLSFIRQYRTAYKFFDYVSGNPQPKMDIFPDPHEKKTLTVSIKPYMMARIINLQRFLSNYHVSKDINDQFSIKVVDQFIEKNDKVWEIEINNGTISINQSSKDSYDCVISIQRLTQILFGYRKSSEIFDWDLNENAIDHLNKLSKNKLVPMLWDYF